MGRSSTGSGGGYAGMFGILHCGPRQNGKSACFSDALQFVLENVDSHSVGSNITAAIVVNIVKFVVTT
jgi:hypothetical protein